MPPSYSDEILARDAPSRGPAAAAGTIPRNGSSNGIAQTIGRLRSESSVSRTRERSDSSVDRLSIHSDDSEVYPSRRNRADSAAGAKKFGNGHPSNASSSSHHQTPAGFELTAAEESAKTLQNVLAPLAPETAAELSQQVRDTISAVLRYLRASTGPRRPEQYREVDELVLDVEVPFPLGVVGGRPAL